MCAIKTSQNELYGKYPCWRCLRKYTNVHSMNVNVVVCFLSAFFALRHSLDLWVHPTDRHEVITHFFTLPVSIMHYSKYSMERRPTCKCNARLLTIHYYMIRPIRWVFNVGYFCAIVNIGLLRIWPAQFSCVQFKSFHSPEPRVDGGLWTFGKLKSCRKKLSEIRFFWALSSETNSKFM